MYHVELSEASNRLHRFNLGEQELAASLLQPWVRGERFNLGERTWNARAGAILVLEGPEIPIGRLTMGRGWSVAQKEGTDVTQQMLQGVRERLAAIAAASAAPAASEPQQNAAAIGLRAFAMIAPQDADVLADALGLELLRGLGETPMSLAAAWRIAVQRHRQLPLGAALELTQMALISLASSNLVTIARSGGGEATSRLRGAQIADALSSIDAWISESGSGALWFRRA